MKLNLHESNIGELYTRIKAAEEEIVKLHTETNRLDRVKTELSFFLKTKKKFEIKNIEHDVKLFKCTNHVITHDNFYDKYLPIRTQALINETLRATLSGKERRRLELYDNDKNSLLYQALLCDDGTGNVLEQMRLLHAKASAEITEEERRKKRRLAITEASASQSLAGNEEAQ